MKIWTIVLVALIGCSPIKSLLGNSSNLPDAGIPTSTPTFLFVGTTGNDGNACVTSAYPCLTIQGAVNKVPKLIRSPYVITAAPGVYGAGAYIDGFTFDVGSYTPNADAGPYLAIEGTMAQAALGGLMTGGIASATAGTPPEQGASGPTHWSTVTVTDAGWTSNALAGSQLCITSGTKSPECSLVYTNTATIATLVGVWTVGTPSAADTFQVQTWATVIDGGLDRPPGGAGQLGFSSVPTSFFLTSNNATGWRTLDYTGMGNSSGPVSSPSFVEPPISINRFSFYNADGAVSLGATGPQLIDFSHNSVTYGVAVRSVDSNIQAMGNYLSQDNYGDPLVWTGGYDDRSKSFSFLFGYGNYCTMVSAGGGNSCFQFGGSALIEQNAMLESDGSHTEGGTFPTGSGAYVRSIGNEYSALNQAIEYGNYAAQETVWSDSDDFTGDFVCIEEPFQSTIRLHNNPPTGTGNHIGIHASNGTVIQLTGVSALGLGDAGDFELESTLYTTPYLLNDGGILRNDLGGVLTYQSINPGAILNEATGAAIYK